jgi:hypothetical protein
MAITGTVLSNIPENVVTHELVLRDRARAVYNVHIRNGRFEFVHTVPIYRNETVDGMPVSVGRFTGISFVDGAKVYESKDDHGISQHLKITGSSFVFDKVGPLLTRKIR